MKKLSELTISPAPWSFADDGIGEYDIRCSGVSYGEDYEGDDIIAQSVQKKDAPMLAAAPNMYKTEYDLVDVVERLMNGWAGTCDTPSQDDVVAALEAAKKALSKAAGEEPANN